MRTFTHGIRKGCPSLLDAFYPSGALQGRRARGPGDVSLSRDIFDALAALAVVGGDIVSVVAHDGSVAAHR